MAKQLTFEYDGRDYTLEFTRNTIRTMEQRGFVADDIDKKPMTMLPDLFAGAFLAHHRNTDRRVIDKIFELQSDKMGLLDDLAEMFAEPFNTLLADPKEGEIKRTKNW